MAFQSSITAFEGVQTAPREPMRQTHFGHHVGLKANVNRSAIVAPQFEEL